MAAQLAPSHNPHWLWQRFEGYRRQCGVELRDERRASTLSLDLYVTLVDAINDSDCDITIPAVPVELRRRLAP